MASRGAVGLPVLVLLRVLCDNNCGVPFELISQDLDGAGGSPDVRGAVDEAGRASNALGRGNGS